MHISKNEIPARIDAPGAIARHLPDFGVASGPLAAEFFTLGGGVDLEPLLKGLEGDSCHSAHWGYMITGEVVVTYRDEANETCSAGDVFHWPAGHSVRVVTDANVIMFSPQVEHGLVLDHILGQMTNA